MTRPRHKDDLIEAVLREAEARGWTFTVSNTKFKGRCGCGKHQHVVNSGAKHNRTAKNLRSQLMTCWLTRR